MISELIEAKGKDVLYVGDHIFGDILRSKKEHGWRTFLVVPEMSQELKVWTEQKNLFDQIEILECQMADSYRYSKKFRNACIYVIMMIYLKWIWNSF